MTQPRIDRTDLDLMVGGDRIGEPLLIAMLVGSLLVAALVRSARRRDDVVKAAAVRFDPKRVATDEWALLPGVGPSLASKLTQARESGLDLGDPVALDSVKGVGPKMHALLIRHVELTH
ncbi:MAG: hypothetical protein O2800_05750 [Planctomycetota bacterium]|nr:hypothetical protein [Planctomycetota bacterium]